VRREIKAPSVGESITEVRIGKWMKQNGEGVKSGDVLLEIESDKATVEVASDYTGALAIMAQPGDTVAVGAVIGYVEEGIAGKTMSSGTTKTTATAAVTGHAQPPVVEASGGIGASMPLSPAVRKQVLDAGLDASQIPGTGKDGRITKGDVIAFQQGSGAARPAPAVSVPPAQTYGDNVGRQRRVPMSLLRQRIAERLVQAQHTAAILTTFNECDMTAVNEIRAKHKDSFKSKYGVSLSFMSFFTKATVRALKEVPAVNASIDGKDIVYHDYYDIGVAVGTDRGLVVPVLREVGQMSFADIEKGIGALALRAREGKLSIKELSGGTFTISNGGTYGSLMSTPILNPPQSGILGMHKIMDRPMAVNGQVLIRPMMYIALSYDHRIVDGVHANGFLYRISELLEAGDFEV
jgi:2-oxoglutarate dehydrogenase E2 component (dihydrolipoamide succinyltransferase)